MLLSIKIHNIALITDAKIELGAGFNVLTGETGAGKSIIIDALTFVLGDRADKTLIKSGESEASVIATFDIDPDREDIGALFDECGIERDNIVTISRLMTTSGKNECRINGNICSLSTIRRLTRIIVSIYGQFEHQDLLNVSRHIAILDSLDEKGTGALKDELRELLDTLAKIDEDIHSFGGTEEERTKEAELLEYALHEIEEAGLSESEEEKLVEEKNILNNYEHIYQGLSDTISALDGEFGLASVSRTASVSLTEASKYDTRLSEYQSRIDNIKYDAEDLLSSLESYKSRLDFDPNRRDDVMRRLDVIHDIYRKYGGSYECVQEYLASARDKLSKLANCGAEIARLEAEKVKVLDKIYDICLALTRLRADISKVFCQGVMLELRDLGIPNSQVVVDNKSTYDRSNIESIVTRDGADDIEIMFSANMGEPAKPLTRIISGGEMSRFMLAIKAICHGSDTTMIFDEVDSGIGGVVGSQVAKKLYVLSRKNQVICISHLPQLACMADTHFKITKYTKDDHTYTSVEKLDFDGQVLELERMLAGSHSEVSTLHAKELLAGAANIKNNLK